MQPKSSRRWRCQGAASGVYHSGIAEKRELITREYLDLVVADEHVNKRAHLYVIRMQWK
jgi:hypothetical protein